MKGDAKILKELISEDIPIAATVLVNSGFVSRTTLWRLERSGMPVIRIGRRLFVKFSDLTSASTEHPK